jgi:RHS repeat-associated protein
VRYSNGAFPTEYGYTGQRADATTGLDYYGARYYDPLLAQFTSADTIMDGFNRYTYVGGNPTSATDPSGHELLTQDPAFDPGATAETGGGGGGGINPIPLLRVVGGALGFVGTLAWPPTVWLTAMIRCLPPA